MFLFGTVIDVTSFFITQQTHDHTITDKQQHNRHDTTRHDTTRHDTTRHDTTRHDTTRHDTTRHDTTRHDTTRHDTTRHDTTRQPATRHDTEQQRHTASTSTSTSTSPSPAQIQTHFIPSGTRLAQEYLDKFFLRDASNSPNMDCAKVRGFAYRERERADRTSDLFHCH